MHSILFFPPLTPLTQTEKQNCSCFTGWGDYFIYIVHTGSGKPGYTQQTENQWTTMTHLENPNTKWWRVLDNRNPAWDCEKKNKASCSLCRAFGLAAAAPTGTCFPWQCCAARPQLQTVGSPLHTHDLRDSQPANRQKIITPIPIEELETSPYTPERDLDVCSCINLATTLYTQKGFLPGHNSVSSLREETVSRDDSMVMALPSNILPENKRSLDLLKQLWQNHFRKYGESHVFEKKKQQQPSTSVWKLSTD